MIFGPCAGEACEHLPDMALTLAALGVRGRLRRSVRSASQVRANPSRAAAVLCTSLGGETWQLGTVT
jgi:hypothetical protein